MATVNFERGPNYKLLNKKKNKPYYFKKKKQPLVLTFDEEAREDFLTGFRKRKLQRKKQAQDELVVQLKAEKKRIRVEAKDAYKKLVVSHRDIPELGQIYEDADVVDMDTHEVKVTELDPQRLARENNWIGANQIQYEEPANLAPEESAKEDTSDDEIEGMETKIKKKKTVKKTENSQLNGMKTAKDVKKFVKKVATKNVQKSKVFQKKKNVEAVKNKRKKMREERMQEKGFKRIKSKREKSRRNQNNTN